MTLREHIIAYLMRWKWFRVFAMLSADVPDVDLTAQRDMTPEERAMADEWIAQNYDQA